MSSGKMPPRTGEAHRALELLEQYHALLTRPSDIELRLAIERVLSVFKTNLFQALCDIQDYYENTLLNERVPLPQKTLETRRLADRWEQFPPFGTSTGTGGTRPFQFSTPSPQHHRDHSRESYGGGGLPYTNGGLLSEPPVGKTTTTSSHSYSYQEQSRQLTNEGWQAKEYKHQMQEGPGGYQTQTSSSAGLVDEQGREWEVEAVVLEKSQTGLGFSIAGGSDRDEHFIRVSGINEGGAVARDGRIKTGDVIMKVDTTNCLDVPHDVAVEALKQSGTVVRLLVRRLKSNQPTTAADLFNPEQTRSLIGVFPTATTTSAPTPPLHRYPSSAERIFRLEREPDVYRVELNRVLSADGQSKGLGLSIAGGVGNEHYTGDTGIFITRVIEGSPAYFNGRLQKGDQILAVDNILFENVPHQFAVDTLKTTGTRVLLLYRKCPYPELEAARQLEESDRSRSLQGFADISGQAPPDRLSTGSQPHLVGVFQPSVPVHEEPGPEPRMVMLRKGEAGLGFNIVGGENTEPIYISYVMPGGVADLSGNVRRGDVLLRVNDVNLNNASHSEAAMALKACPVNSTVQLVLQYRPHDFHLFEQKLERVRDQMIQQQQQQQSRVHTPAGTPTGIAPPLPRDIYVRALFENDPSRDTAVPHRSLPFHYGDVLHVTNMADDDWWTARRVDENGDESTEGVIPSRKRVEKRERQRRKQVNFNAGSQSLGRGASLSSGIGIGSGLEGRRGSRSQLSFSRKFPFVKSTDRLNEGGFTSEGELTTLIQDEPIFSYEPVEHQHISYVRPVIILGALKDRINDELVSRQPDRFASCVPHTSRPPRANEVNGRDYYFVTKAEMERDVKNNLFIEAGQYQGNLYGTSISAVQEVAASGRHCILDVSGNAIRRLQTTANVYPIVAFVKPLSIDQLRDWDPMLSDDDLQKQFDRCQRQEQTFGDLFTAVVTGHSSDDVLGRVLYVINSQSRSRCWVPTRQPLP